MPVVQSTGRGPTVYHLVSKPFGPFLDSTILSPACKTTPQKPVELRNVLLEHDGEPTGLTLCEETQPESYYHSGGANSQIPVRMRGLLAIKNLSWLSDEGRDLLTKALRRRDYNIRRKKHGSNTRESNLSLGNVFNPNGKLHHKKTYIKVIIQANKEGPAVYMNSEIAPGFLVLRTGDRGRTYKILGMDSETYKRSHLFLSRYRVLHDLRTIVNLPSSRGTSMSEHSPEWFVSQYVEHLAYKENADEDHSIRSSASSSSSNDSDSEELYLPPNKRRRVRHISRAEVLSLLAMHVRWLIGEQKKQKFSKLFDPIEWGRFEAEAYKYRQNARLENLQWGTFRGEVTAFEENESSSSEDGMDIDGSASRRPPRRKKRPSIPALRRRRHHPSSEPVSTTELTFQNPLDDTETFANRYDSDFTTDGSSSSDSDSDSLHSRSCSPTLGYTPSFPSEILVPPTMPQNGSWICPVNGCLYDINLRQLNREQEEILWPEEIEYISSATSNIKNPVAIECFTKLASKHYEDHLAACGVALVNKGRQVRKASPDKHIRMTCRLTCVVDTV
ncbi:hypothetical protein BDY19DRAFT_988675 [Irpex rosettiformis]|uniref:Uncharacterized protein n=1 Tax=Irpex rosettiformis TaxID=378272 RepID=A0ACB8UMV6_9APHY|nr:hypothetical protein BDY19DRAFT_988675 [Irpex rosettiformis]